jgi:hypothetical protein
VRSGTGGEIGSAGDMKTAPRIRSRWSVQSTSPAAAEPQCTTIAHSGTPAASSTASASRTSIRGP